MSFWKNFIMPKKILVIDSLVLPKRWQKVQHPRVVLVCLLPKKWYVSIHIIKRLLAEHSVSVVVSHVQSWVCCGFLWYEKGLCHWSTEHRFGFSWKRGSCPVHYCGKGLVTIAFFAHFWYLFSVNYFYCFISRILKL